MTRASPGPLEEKPRVLVVDDEKFIRIFSRTSWAWKVTSYAPLRTVPARSPTAAGTLRHGHQRPEDARMGGLELLKEVSHRYPDTLTVIMTGFGTVETAIDAMKRGAYDYILKPFKVEEIFHIVERGLEKRRLSART